MDAWVLLGLVGLGVAAISCCSGSSESYQRDNWSTDTHRTEDTSHAGQEMVLVEGSSRRFVAPTASKPEGRPPTEPPRDGLHGEWVRPEEFDLKKSFGWFQCRQCRRWWDSAHSWKDFTQDCQRCEQAEYPVWMWVNYNPIDPSDRGRPTEKSNKPHDQARCGRCRYLGSPCWQE